MAGTVAVIGVGYTPIRSSTPDASYRELTFEAAQRAYADAGITTDEIDSAICCEEDFFEGVSITDEYTPDQLGVVLKPVETVTGDGLHGLAVGAMQIQTGAFDVVVVEAHSKASNILTFEHIQAYALDPMWNRPLGLAPNFIAGLDMDRFLHESGSTLADCDEVVASNRTRALANPIAAYPGKVESADVERSPDSFTPLRKAHQAQLADGAVVLVLASEERASSAPNPVWVRGTGWANASPTLESREWGTDQATAIAGKMAMQEAGVSDPSDIDLFEVDDTFAYRQLMTLQALGAFGVDEKVNTSGGSLGMGLPLDAVGLYRAAYCVEAVRQGKAQLALAQAWRGVPTTSSAVAVFGSNNG